MHEFTHQLPRARVVDRAEYLREIAHARQVIHLGFVDEGRMNAKREQESWLHEQLSTSASELACRTRADGTRPAAAETAAVQSFFFCPFALPWPFSSPGLPAFWSGGGPLETISTT